MKNILSTNLNSLASAPYFLWDEPMTVTELKERLATGSQPERIRLPGKSYARRGIRMFGNSPRPKKFGNTGTRFQSISDDGASFGGSCLTFGNRKVYLAKNICCHSVTLSHCDRMLARFQVMEISITLPDNLYQTVSALVRTKKKSVTEIVNHASQSR